MTRRAAWIAAALTLGLPSAAAADHPRGAGVPAVGLEHVRQHAEIWKAQAKARERWRRMPRSERRQALRPERRAMRRVRLRAQAAAEEPREVGSWDPPFVMREGYSGYAVHAALLHTGKVLMWGDRSEARTSAYLWDPAQGDGPDAFRDVTPTDESGVIPIFCSGMSFLADGRLLVVGGTLTRGNEDLTDEYEDWAGLNRALVFDPVTEAWSELPRPSGSDGRWYPTQVLLPDGRTLVVSGYGEAEPGAVLNDGHEIYDPVTNSFSLLNGPEQRRETGLYPHMFAMPDGTVAVAGPYPNDAAIFDPANLADPWTDLPPLPSHRSGGNAVMLPDGPAGTTEIAMIGGRLWGEPPGETNTMIDLAAESPAWSSFPALGTQRFDANTVLLPDRSMVTIGGDESPDKTEPLVRAVELYDPVTGSWRVGPSQVETRAYHSTAVLLPDARVLSTGDDRYPKLEGVQSPFDTGEIYSPPYLFAGPRPTISSAPAAVRWDVPFSIETTGDVDDAVLIAPAAVTHANDMNQRLVPLAVAAEHPGGVTLQSPPSAGVAPPGWYMLFVLDDGVPSIAKWVRLDGAAADVTAPTLQLDFRQDRWLRRLRRTARLRVRVTIDEPATVDLMLRRRTRPVARARVHMRAGSRAVSLRPRRRALASIAGQASRLRFSVVAADAAGNTAKWTRVLGR